jgi:hypothetical protein
MATHLSWQSLTKRPSLYIERRIVHDPSAALLRGHQQHDFGTELSLLPGGAVLAETNVDPDCTSNKVATFP